MAGSSILIIAEAGVNHNGSLDRALQMVDAAAKAGADAIKFQTFRADQLVCRNAGKAEYQRQTTPNDESQHAMLKKLELDLDAHRILLDHCREKGIRFLSSPFDLESVEALHRLGLDIYKIPSGELTNLPYLRAIGRLGRRVILSTGMAELDEVGAAFQVLRDSGTSLDSIVLLHCNTEYPTPMEDVNLLAMQTLARRFAVQVGYSDHTRGIEVAIAAAALGAVVIEKHFTLDRALPGPDHQASLMPEELHRMVAAIRNIEKALGAGVKQPSPSELKNRPVARKSIVAACAISKGEFFSPENITVKRPGTGLSPMLWDMVIGQQAMRDFLPDEMIELP